MEFDVKHTDLLRLFFDDFYEHRRNPDLKNWAEFVKSRDIGVEVHNYHYRVVDEKKWLLARIKYGI